MKEYDYQEIRYARKWFDWSVYYIHPKRNKSIYDKVLMGWSFVIGCVIKNLVVVWSNVSKNVYIHTEWLKIYNTTYVWQVQDNYLKLNFISPVVIAEIDLLLLILFWYFILPNNFSILVPLTEVYFIYLRIKHSVCFQEDRNKIGELLLWHTAV